VGERVASLGELDAVHDAASALSREDSASPNVRLLARLLGQVARIMVALVRERGGDQ